MIDVKKAFLTLWLAVFSLCLHADEVRLLSDGSEALANRIALIQAAKSEIIISTFLVYRGEAVAKIHNELLKAAARGVKIYYLADDYGLKDKPTVAELGYLNLNGIEFRSYNPMTANFFKYYHRQHDKILLVDKKTLVVGGRNHWNHSFGIHPSKPHSDLDVLVEGKSVAEARGYFFGRWARSKELFKAEISTDQKLIAENSLAKETDLEIQPGFDQAKFANESKSKSIAVEDSRFIYDRKALGETGPNHIDELTKLIDDAKYSLYIETPWLVLTPRTRAALLRAKLRGVAIQVLTNSANSSEDIERYDAMRITSRKFFADHNIPLFEFKPKATPGLPVEALHSKYIVVDGEKTYIGSFNFGPRSEYNNFETGLLISSEAFGQEMEGLIADRLKHSAMSPDYDRKRDGNCGENLRQLVSPKYWRTLLRSTQF